MSPSLCVLHVELVIRMVTSSMFLKQEIGSRMENLITNNTNFGGIIIVR